MSTQNTTAKISFAPTWNAEAFHTLTADSDEQHFALLTGGTVLTLDPRTGDFPQGDVLFGGETIYGVGPGLLTAAGDDGMILIDCTGMTIVPAVIDGLALLGLRSARTDRIGTVTSGNRMDLAVIPTEFAGTIAQAADTLINAPEKVVALWSKGEIVRWDSVDLRSPSTGAGNGIEPQDLSSSPYLGMWIDEKDFLYQELTADGRYDETRGGRPHAYQGRFWIDGTRIDYLDDLGFWAFGDFVGNRLHHVMYRLDRK